MPQTLTIAVCICEDVTLSDFIPPVEILAHLNGADHNLLGPDLIGDAVPYRVKIDYLAPTLDPVRRSHRARQARARRRGRCEPRGRER
ncbi:hypothetical protein FIBSPDRAFT_780042 [Athelia psychrophila]|uniref:Uncharacterized protein n=1 Tax=Athelia psychrophila TaxID=1759441 RepID=A0A166RI15_9AGAM|nr:hypothetical protein FIBSPDRAFT_780042 [Fibularhizoctonia sp. CBS 109695]